MAAGRREQNVLKLHPSQQQHLHELMQTTIEEEEITATNYSDHLNQEIDDIMHGEGVW